MDTLKTEMKECAAGSTMHGLPKAAKHNVKPIRILWILICAAAITFMAVHFAYLFNRFIHSPVTTVFSVNKSSNNLPKIIVCGFTMSMPTLEALLTSVLQTTVFDFERKQVLEAIKNHSAEGGHNKPKIRVTTPDFLMRCAINQIDCTDESNWHLIGDIGKHRCFQLIPPANMIDEDPTNVELHVYMDSVSDSNSNLRKKLDEMLEYDFTFYLHTLASASTCIESKSGLKISPGAQYDVSLRSLQSVLKSLPNVDMDIPKCSTSEPRLVRYCDTHHNLNGQVPYYCYEDSRLCLANRIQELALDQCNETSRYHNSHFIYFCPSPSSKKNKSKMNDSECMRKILTDRKLIERLAVSCTACEELKWKSSVLYSAWPREDMAWFFHKASPINHTRFQEKLKEKLQNNFGFIPTDNFYKIFTLNSQSDVELVREIYDRHIAYIKIDIDLHVDMMVEEFAYPFISYMGEVGGIMGLWLGCSVITFLEPIEFIMRILVRFFKPSRIKGASGTN